MLAARRIRIAGILRHPCQVGMGRAVNPVQQVLVAANMIASNPADPHTAAHHE